MITDIPFSLSGPCHLTIHLTEFSLLEPSMIKSTEDKSHQANFYSSFFWLLSGLRDTENNDTSMTAPFREEHQPNTVMVEEG